MAIYLRKNRLENLVAISYISPTDSIWVEKLANDFDGTVANQVRYLGESCMKHYTITEWVIQEGFSEPFMVPPKACKKLDNGGHDRIPG